MSTGGPSRPSWKASGGFFPAEAHRQKFMDRNPTYPYIVYNDRPKVEALKAMFPAD